MRYDRIKNVFAGELKVGTIPNLMWHITDKCPLSCPYCFAPKSHLEMPLEAIENRLDKLIELEVLKVDLSGGEPLVYPWLEQLCKKIENSSLQQTITTSGVGTLRNKEFVLDNVELFSRIIISIDGPDSAHHDAFRGIGAFDSACNLLREAIERCSDRVRVNTVITKDFIDNDWFMRMSALLPIEAEWCLIEPHPANEKPGFKEHKPDSNTFKEYISLVSKTSKQRLLTRYSENYSAYWSLQPDGTLRQHSTTASDRNSISIDEATASELIEFVAKTDPSWFPKSK